MEREYTIIVEKADGNWSGYSPDVPGVIATDTTADTCAARLRDAIEFHIEGLKEFGLPIPEPSAVVSTIRVAA